MEDVVTVARWFDIVARCHKRIAACRATEQQRVRSEATNGMVTMPGEKICLPKGCTADGSDQFVRRSWVLLEEDAIEKVVNEAVA